MYADDTTLFCNFDNIRNENTINNEINNNYLYMNGYALTSYP